MDADETQIVHGEGTYMSDQGLLLIGINKLDYYG